MEPQDTITIAPSVLITIARHAALEVNGVAHMGVIPVSAGRRLKGHSMGSGVVLEIEDKSVAVDLYLVVKQGANMRKVGNAVQQSVSRAIVDLVGMQVNSVNVHVEDVAVDLAE